MPPGILLLTGAPASSSLDWKRPDLLDGFSEPFLRFAHLEQPQRSPEHQVLRSPVLPAWRSLPLQYQHLPTGHSYNHVWQEGYHGTEFFTTNSFVEEVSQPSLRESQKSIAESVDQTLSQFYELSYAVHEDIASSQIAPASDFSSSSNISFSATDSSNESHISSLLKSRDVPIADHLCHLKDVPNASYLNSIQPQTMTVNIIIGIISIPQPRLIKTRRGTDVELIEVLAGDETKSGFGINFWLPSSQTKVDDSRSILGCLRAQDVVLLQNVALSSFRGKVYGQSLRKGITKVHLLYRDRIDKSDLGGCYKNTDLSGGEALHPQLHKTRSVREWVLRFVGGGGPGHAKGQMDSIKETLPPDTQ